MRKRLTGTLALVGALGAGFAGLAGADKPVTVQVGGLLPIINGGFSPKLLPKGKLAHVAMNESGQVEVPLSGARPPALQEVILELDKNLAIDARFLPVCPPGNVESAPLPERCRPAFIGQGTMSVEVEFPEQKATAQSRASA